MAKGVTPDHLCRTETNTRLEVDNDAPFGLSQDISIFSDGFNSCDSDDSSSQRNALSQCIARCEDKNIQSNSSKNVYSQLITSFREMTNVYEGNCNKDDIDSMLCYFQKSVGNMKTKIVSNKGHIAVTTGNQFVNSNVKCSKKRKSHGVKF